MRRALSLALAACVAAALALTPALALAAPEELPPLPEDFSAADQYVESVPTGDGGRPARRGRGGSGAPADLPPGVRGRLRAGSELARIATSPALGAPTRKLRGKDAAAPSVPSAAVRAVDGGGRSGLAWLVIALAAASLLLVAAALLRRRRGEEPRGG